MKKIQKWWKILLGFCLISMVVAGIALKVSINQKKEEQTQVKKAIDKLKSLEAGKEHLSQLEEKIQQMDDATRTVEESTSNTGDLKARFIGSVVVGDSLTEGLIAYQMLNQDSVVYKRGVSVKNIRSLLDTTIGMNPNNVFLSFGMNDIEAFTSNIEGFIQNYKEKIQYLQQGLPQAKIYVNSIQPASKGTVAKRIEFKRVPEYNEAIEKMCEELSIVFIDNQYILEQRPDLYEQDGIHVSSSYYPIWLENMAEKAGI